MGRVVRLPEQVDNCGGLWWLCPPVGPHHPTTSESPAASRTPWNVANPAPRPGLGPFWVPRRFRLLHLAYLSLQKA